ncbi:MAG: hypothetical protein A2Y10_00875 [Planctomycetes bacterium GWF2_41_51]|nr:MAG: hypothetical protein A2Y10_00875 [Planctomycetes bacterium GWF2_41_51]HBG28113.1 hypothetical protein [Phycisphaerales bacterium]
MNKKMVLILSFIAMITFAGNVNAAMKTAPLHTTGDADEQWAPLGGGSIGQNWSNPENWWHNAVPTSTQKAKLNRTPGPIISGVVDVNQIFISEGNILVYEYPSCLLKIVNGANVTVRQSMILGYYLSDRGKLQIDGGTTNINRHLFIGRSGNGELTINGGTVNVLGNFVISHQGGNGNVKLNGGTLHINQLTYEYNLQEKVNPTDPDVEITPGKASLDISGGQIIHDSNARDCNAVAADYRTMASLGKLTAYNGMGDPVARINPITHQVIVTGEKMLWDFSDITVTSHSTMDNDAISGIDKMFKSAVTDSNAAIFLDGPGTGGVYTVEWETPGDVTLNSIEMIAERDDIDQMRAVRHFTLKAKVPSTSPTFNVVVYDGDVSYTSNIYDLNYNLPSLVTSGKFRAEFTGNDEKAPRIRILNAIGSRQAEHLWNSNQIAIVPGGSPVIMDPLQPGLFDIANMFETRRTDNMSTIFMNGTGAGYVYNLTFRPIEQSEIQAFELVAEMDGGTSSRAATHFTLKAKSVGSNTYDKILYDGDIAIQDYVNNVYNLNVNLAPENFVTAQEIRAEFTGGIDENGVRIRELNAMGVKSGIQQLWEIGNVAIGDRSSYQIYTQRFDIDNVFQKEGTVSDPCSDSVVFEDLGTNEVYYVEWKTRSTVEVAAFNVKATHDSATAPINPNGRAMKHLTVKAKSIGSSTYDLTLYNADVAVPYNAPYDANVLDLWINLPAPVTAREFRAEFTGNDSYGVRINELNAIGYIQANVGGDMDSDADVDFEDFATFAGNWRIDNSTTPLSTQTLETFESYSAIPNATWSNWLGQTSTGYNNLALETSVIHSGTKALKWTYDLNPDIVIGDDKSGIVYTMAAPVNLKNYSKFKVWINRQAGNSLENFLAVRFYWAGALHDSRIQAEAVVLSANGSTQTPTGWSEWIVDLNNDLIFKNRTSMSGNDLYNVGQIVLYVCNRLQFRGGPGTIYVDDVALTGKCTSPASDFNGDCRVDFFDLKTFAENWLQGK